VRSSYSRTVRGYAQGFASADAHRYPNSSLLCFVSSVHAVSGFPAGPPPKIFLFLVVAVTSGAPRFSPYVFFLVLKSSLFVVATRTVSASFPVCFHQPLRTTTGPSPSERYEVFSYPLSIFTYTLLTLSDGHHTVGTQFEKYSG
jgi:hypothetical protein